VDGLKRLRRPEDVARSRGKSIKDVLPYRPAVAADEPTSPEPPAPTEVVDTEATEEATE
jgi:hypothetical protein